MTALAIPAFDAAVRQPVVEKRDELLVLAKGRLFLVFVIFFTAGLLALSRLAYLGVTTAGTAHNSANALLPQRGEITDRNGVPLAKVISVYSLWFNPDALGGGTALVKPADEVARQLVAIFPDLDVNEVTRRLKSGKPGYIRKRLLPAQVNRVHEIGEPGLEAPREVKRYYPQGALGAHVLGFVTADGDGKVGMEAVLQKELTDPATRAAPAQLSIDIRVQGALEDELARGMVDSRAKGAAGIILDVHTGEVIALASLPSFNPNFISQQSTADIFNRATNQVYELGSTFKPITVAAALDAGTITDVSRRYSASPLRIGRFTIKDSHPLGSSLSVVEGLMHSSNIVMAEIGEEMGGARLKAKLEHLGFNRRPDIELPARGMPIWRSGNWARISTMTISFGHGIAVTPLHLANAYAALVNGGILRPATLHKVDPDKIPEGQRVFGEETSARMRQMLRTIVKYGTGRKADVPGYRIGGKTGSAEKAGSGGYQRRALISTFAAVFPMDDPRYVVLTMYDEPQGTPATSYQRTAAWNAAPAVGRTVARVGPMLGIMPDNTRDVDMTDIQSLLPASRR